MLKTQRQGNPATSRRERLVEGGGEIKGMLFTTFRCALISLLELAESNSLRQASSRASRYTLSPHDLAVVLADLHLHHSLAGGQAVPSQDFAHTEGHPTRESLPKADRWLRELSDHWMAEFPTTTLADLQPLADVEAS